MNDENINSNDKLFDKAYLNSLPLLAGRGRNVGSIPKNASTVGRNLTIGEKLLARRMFGNDIEYSKVGSSLTDYGIEKQAAIVADHWLRKNGITIIKEEKS